MNRLDQNRRTQVISSLVEGNSIKSTVRMTGVAKNTIIKLLEEIGAACIDYQDKAFNNLSCKRLQFDETWSFAGEKKKKVPDEKQGVFGISDVWTWSALDTDTKLVTCWHVGKRDAKAAHEFLTDIASRLHYPVQLKTEGRSLYLEAVETTFGCDLDYAMLVKIYGKEQEEALYSPAKYVGAQARIISEAPNKKHILSSSIERQNLTMKMPMRHFPRPMNGFSRKLENFFLTISLYYMYYNFVRIHKTVRCTPAMAAGVTTRPWEVSDITELLA